MPKTTVKEEGKIETKEGKVSPKAGLEKGEKEKAKEPGEWDKDEQENETVAEKSVKPKPGKEEEGAEVADEKGKVGKTVLPEKEKEIAPGKASPIKEIISQVEKMTVLELSDLVKALEERFGVVAAAPAPAGMVPMGTPAEEVKEKTEWSVILTAIGEKKIQVIKEVRAVTSLGLKEAKTLVEEAPKPVKEGILQKEAEEIKAKLEAVGATVELK